MPRLRPIEPLPAWDGMPKDPHLGPRPTMRWVAPTSLMIDDGYQRDLGRRSYALIRKAVTGFSWAKMQWPKVVEVDGALHIVNGQHTAIAAATLGIDKIPVIVDVGAHPRDRAASFVALNQDRVAMTTLDVFRARIAAGDADAQAVQAACAGAGMRLRVISPYAKILPGDTAAVSTISRIVKKHGRARGQTILSAFVKGDRGPVSAAELDAVEALMHEVAPGASAERVGAMLRAFGDNGVVQAQARAKGDHRPVKHVLLEEYSRRLAKQKAA